MKIRGSDFYGYYQPAPCELRVYLAQRGMEAAPPGPYEEVLRRLGDKHEQVYLKSLPPIHNLAVFPPAERLEETESAIHQKIPILYHSLFSCRQVIRGRSVDISGEPDLLVLEDGRYVVRDIKMSRRIQEKEHPEIFKQLQLYGWLFERLTGTEPKRLEVYTGAGTLETIPYDQGRAALELIEAILAWQDAGEEPFSPVGWTKCNGCGFHGYCWPRAVGRNAAAIVPGVDQGLARVLQDRGVATVAQLVAAFDWPALAELVRPWGRGEKKVGKLAEEILNNAQALAGHTEIMLAKPLLPECDNFVMFDLEGLPPQLNDLQKIYLWGMQVFGENPGPFSPALAGFGQTGDRIGWEEFLQGAQRIFNAYGDIPFVHWHHYEKTNIKMYIGRFGDTGGVAARVLANCLDLLPITKKSVALPLPSYSLKVVEKYIGFKRTQDEYGGDWSIAKYIEATEMEDRHARQAVMDEILKYNEEDLKATWAVFQWLKQKAA